jgi:isochorismate synthase
VKHAAAPGHEHSSASGASAEHLLCEARTRVSEALVDAPFSATCAVTFAAPLARPERVLRALPHDEAWYFGPASGLAMVALGAAWRAEARCGAGDLARARLALAERFEGLVHRVGRGALEVEPRALLGLAFDPRSGASAPWRDLGAGALVIPRWTYWARGDAAALTLMIARNEAPDGRALARELEIIFDVLKAAEAPAPAVGRRDVSHSPMEEWIERIERIKRAVLDGEASKIVAARRTRVRADGTLDALDLLRRVGHAPEGATRYFVRRGATSFLGCTPERLFVKHGRALETEALAGTISASSENAASKLEASVKDRDEHARVVEHLVERLGPLSVRVDAAEAPRVRRLPTVLHLSTPVVAELSPSVDAFALLAALHPTPAVCGTPADVARRFIAEHEPDRGWYAAPLGYVDVRGDAEIFVGLRCMTVRDREAMLWAGAGVVAGSEPEREWEETMLKMRPMLRALGAL